MQWISDSNILIVGLGQIGGSYARALKHLGYYVSAIDRDRTAIDYATREGIIDEGSTEVDPELVGSADAVIFCLYPGVLLSWIRHYQRYLKHGALLTDVTGVKRCTVYEIQELLRPDLEFIAAHPMAGRETDGVEHSDAELFLGANYIITPTEQNSDEAIEWCASLGRLLGCRGFTVLSPEDHDDVVAQVSQLTHCIAVALITCGDGAHLADCSGDSFRDLTRVALANDELWSELLLRNKAALLPQLDRFSRQLGTLRDLISADDRDGLRAMLRYAAQRRERFAQESGER